MNIKFSYLYRDAANYKNYNEVVFDNAENLPIQSIETVIKENLIEGQWFIAREWNLPDMHFKNYPWDSEIDHDWHEFDSLEETTNSATGNISMESFLNKIRRRLS